MKINELKSPEDIFEYMNSNIDYGWIDINGEKHIGNMKNFRKTYRTSSIKETIENGIGTCIVLYFTILKIMYIIWNILILRKKESLNMIVKSQLLVILLIIIRN